MTKRKSDYVPHIAPEKAPPCSIKGCRQPGSYKAPTSREALHDYRWFCLEHVREHNQKWDFFHGYDAAAIEAFIRDAVTGHRPTWNRESRSRDQYRQLHDALYEFLHHGKKAPKAVPPLPAKIRKALAVLDVAWPCTARDLKKQYRLLVKKHHPDVNKGDKRSEEVFKRVTVAYHAVSEHLKSSS